MKKVLCNKLSLFLGLLLFSDLTTFSQDFTWMKGSGAINQVGTYGTINVSSATNNPGGRRNSVSWKDASGNFWLFGGEGFDKFGAFGLLNDLWKYDITTGMWTWVSGGDIIAQIGVYGTLGTPATTNTPGSRHSSVAWKDNSGNLWLFGGFGNDGVAGLGFLNDLWKYNITTGEWTWVSGPSICYQAGNYGTLGVPSTTNIPGSRYGSTAWTDATGNLWLFGGSGTTTSTLTSGLLNDLWKYNISTNEWTWMNGNNSVDQPGVYGTMGTSAPANTPGSRFSSSGWIDLAGNFWMFGGEGWDTTPFTTGLLSDLWKYSLSTNEWTWIKGPNSINQAGVYGQQGTPQALNVPGGRSGATAWRDAVNNIWMFGGEGYPAATSGTVTGRLNDLWKYDIAINDWTWMRGNTAIDQNGTYGNQGIPAFTNIPGARGFTTNWIDAMNNLWFFGGFGQPATGSSGGNLNDLWKYTNCFISPITMTITSGDSVICAGESTSLTVVGSTNYLWVINNSTLSTIVIHPSTTTTYSVYTSDNNNCRYTAAFTQTIDACSGLSEQFAGLTLSSVYPNPNAGKFYVRTNTGTPQTMLVIFNALGQKQYERILNSNEILIEPGLPKGLYYYQLVSRGEKNSSGKLLIE